MISWIVATHDRNILNANLALTQDWGEDELVVIDDPVSIAAAYNEGQERARFPIRCYVHHDVQILNLTLLRGNLLGHVTTAKGMVGVVGSRALKLPWWAGDPLGSVLDSRIGTLDFGPGGDCAMLDGLLLATAHAVEWDETIPGFHGYDFDSCHQLLARGLSNFCLSDGRHMVSHNATSNTDPGQLNGFYEAMAIVQEKWSVQP